MNNYDNDDCDDNDNEIDDNEDNDDDDDDDKRRTPVHTSQGGRSRVLGSVWDHA